MTPPAAWHLDEAMLQGYVDGGLAGASVEAHLLACASCRAQLRDGVPPDRLERVFAAVEDRVDTLQRPRLERFLTWVGLQEADVRALLAAPALRTAWLLAVVASVVLAVLNLRNDRDPDAIFLLLAPLVPVATTALAYSPGLDPALQHVAATPYSTTRLLLARSVTVGVTALVGTGCAALALPDRNLASIAWLLPAIALTLLVLALNPRFGAGHASVVVGAAWVSFVVLLHRQGIDVVDLLGVAGQLVCAAIAAVVFVVLVDQQKRGGTS